MSHRRNPFHKQEEEETDLKKMSRGLPKFKNLPKVTSRPDQEIQNIDSDRQVKMFAQKVANDSAFPQQSIRSDIESQIKQGIKKPTPQYLEASRKAAKDRWNYDISDNQLTNMGIVAGGTSQKRPLGMVRDEGSIPTSRRREHEAIHLSLGQIGKKYGHKMEEYAQKKMNDLIHPIVSEHLSNHLHQIGYHRNSHHKELVTHLYEMLHDPKTRDIMRYTNPKFKNNEREIMYHAKKNWNAIRDFASKLKVGDEQ
jgi:hypothetical protein